jgi:EAL domain-containing protein (putative c-di-GMP-specific phosphodiesterase class I)
MSRYRHPALRREHRTLSRALAKGRLSVHYQPIVRVGDRSLYGAEALVRWGSRSPAEFLPDAEASGAIASVDRWVLGQACREAVRWGRRVPRIHVNVSPRTLATPEWIGSVAEVLATTGLPPERLVVELTETAVIEHTDVVVDKLAKVKELGCQIALDDFGAGFAGLTYLRWMPLDILKIDRDYAGHLGQGRLGRLLVKLAREMGIVSLIEGVSSRSIWEKAQATGALLAQGYYLGRPTPPADIEVPEHTLAAACP